MLSLPSGVFCCADLVYGLIRTEGSMYKKVIQFPNKRLREKTKDVKDFSAIGSVIKDMVDTCNVEMAVGLAANQIGYDRSIVVIDISKSGAQQELEGCEVNPNFFVICNPKLRADGEDKSWEEECLSLAGVTGKVIRKSNATLRYQNEKGEQKELIAQWPFSGVLQHECDHLEGITFNFKMKKYPAQRMLKKLYKSRKIHSRGKK